MKIAHFLQQFGSNHTFIILFFSFYFFLKMAQVFHLILPPESLDPYFFTASFVCFSSKALIESDTFLFSLSSSVIMTSNFISFDKS